MKVFRHIIAGVKRGLGLYPPGRSLLILPDDSILAFPKSGNTWVRFLLANLRHPDQPVTFANLRRLIPHPTGATKREFDRVRRPRISKSHECFDPHYPRPGQ